MVSGQREPNRPTEQRIGEILNAYLDRCARNAAESEPEFLAAHPDMADELRADLAMLGDLKPRCQTIQDLINANVLEASQDGQFPARLGVYQIVELLGRGGMGLVLKAFERPLDRTVALKILRPELAEDGAALARFGREAKAAAALRHPNIVTVHSVGREGGTHYLSMEFVPGPTLGDVIRERGPLPSAAVRALFGQMLRALEAAHHAGLIHRDIKPSNILLDPDPDNHADRSQQAGAAAGVGLPAAANLEAATVKIADFGLARILGTQTKLTLDGSTPGTPEYMSPEQAAGDSEVDQRSDLYSAGVVLYAMLTGRNPFQGGAPSAVLHRVRYDPPVNPRTVCQSADRQLADLALALMAKDPNQRPASAGEVITTLETGRKIRPHRPARRRWRRAGLALGFMIALSLGAWGWANAGTRPHITRVWLDETSPTTVWVARDNGGSAERFRDFAGLAEAVGAVALLNPTGDGDQSIVVALQGARGEANLLAFDARGSELHQRDLSSPIPWPDAAPPNRFECRALLAADLDGTAGQELIVVAGDVRHYPTYVAIIEPRSWVTRSTFWNQGGISAASVEPDFFGPGRPAILARGWNNTLDCHSDGCREGERPVTDWEMVTAVMVLDPRDMNGVGPPLLNDIRLPDGLAAAMPYAYACLNLPAVKDTSRVTFSAGDPAPQRARIDTLDPREDCGFIRSFSRAPRNMTTAGELLLEVSIGTYDDEKRPIGRASLIVDRNLNLREVHADTTAGEQSGRTQAYWDQYWIPLIQDGRDVVR